MMLLGFPGTTMPRYLLPLALLLATPLSAQFPEPRFDRVTDEQGLSQATVQGIIQDRFGFLWFGTLDGLDRFDGYGMKSYRHVPSDSTSLPRNDVITLLTDQQGTLWVGTNGGGLARYDVATDNFTVFRHDTADSTTIAEDAIRVIVQGADSALWIGTYQSGVDHFNPATGRCTHFRHRDADSTALSDDRIWTMCVDHRGFLWVGTVSGLNRLDPSTGRVSRYHAKPGGAVGLTSDYIRCLWEDPAGTLWIGTTNGLSRLDGAGTRMDRFYTYPQSCENRNQATVNAVTGGPGGTIWFGTFGGGLGRLDPATGQVTRMTFKAYDATTLSDDNIWTLYRDRDSRLWIGTQGGGVSVLEPRRQQVVHYRHDPLDAGTLSGNNVSVLRVTRTLWPGAIWAGTVGGGLDAINPRSGSVLHFRHDPAKPGSLAENGVDALLETRAGELFVGTRDGLDRFVPQRHAFLHVLPEKFGGERILALCEDRSGKIWIGTALSGVRVYDPARETHKEYRQQGPGKGGLSNNRVLCFLEDHEGIIWVGTDVGLNRFNPATGDFTTYLHTPGDSTGLSNSTIMSMAEDNRHNLWLATYGGGVNVLDPDRRTFTRYREPQGLASDATVGVQVDDAGSAWVSSTRGLSRIEYPAGVITNFTRRDGLQANEFNMHADCRGMHGELLFGGVNGINVFLPDSLRRVTAPPVVQLTEFRVFDAERKLIPSILVSRSIELTFDDNHFAITFAGLDYSAPGNVQYAYMLGGLDETWIPCGTRRSATYTHLPAGTYQFLVHARSGNGPWSNPPRELEITVTPPFWNTLWFKVVVALTVLAFLVALYQYRVRKLIEVERMRLRIAGDLHDDIGSNLSSIALAVDMVCERGPVGKAEAEQLARVSTTARQMGESIREIVWFIRPDHETLNDLAGRMRQVAEGMLGRIDVQFCASGKALDQVCPMEFRRNLFLVFKESLHNIHRHSRATKVEIALRAETGTVSLRIVDNGIGFNLETATSGNGLANLRRRAAELGGTLGIRSRENDGTEILLEVPFRRGRRRE
jgi:ligand-binding sensor domain-containing protein/signal transduction histidine kinase